MRLEEFGLQEHLFGRSKSKLKTLEIHAVEIEEISGYVSITAVLEFSVSIRQQLPINIFPLVILTKFAPRYQLSRRATLIKIFICQLRFSTIACPFTFPPMLLHLRSSNARKQYFYGKVEKGKVENPNGKILLSPFFPPPRDVTYLKGYNANAMILFQQAILKTIYLFDSHLNAFGAFVLTRRRISIMK
jgi:hypothetical protein